MANKPLIYLASPYSDPDPEVRNRRWVDTCVYCAMFVQRGEMVFSPIVHSHPLAVMGVEGGWDFWREFDLRMLSMCDAVRVLCLPGWGQSRGVIEEIRVAYSLGKEVEMYEARGDADGAV